MQEKPKNIDEYTEWLKKEHQIEITDRTRTRYDTTATVIKQAYEESDFWVELVDSLREYNDQYLLDTRYPLLINFEKPELTTKLFDSFFLKTFRKEALRRKSELSVFWVFKWLLC